MQNCATCRNKTVNALVSIYYKPSLLNAHTVIVIVHIFMNANKLCLNQLRQFVRYHLAVSRLFAK